VGLPFELPDLVLSFNVLFLIKFTLPIYLIVFPHGAGPHNSENPGGNRDWGSGFLSLG